MKILSQTRTASSSYPTPPPPLSPSFSSFLPQGQVNGMACRTVTWRDCTIPTSKSDTASPIFPLPLQPRNVPLPAAILIESPSTTLFVALPAATPLQCCHVFYLPPFLNTFRPFLNALLPFHGEWGGCDLQRILLIPKDILFAYRI